MRRSIVFLFAVVLSGSVAACGSSGSGTVRTSASASTHRTSTTLTVELIPLPHVAPIYLGINKGFFAREGLHINPVIVQNGPAGIAALESGAAQIAFTSAIPVLVAQTKGLTLKIISNATNEQSDPARQYYAVLVRAGSPIKNAKDLTGRVVGVNALQAADQLTVSETIDKAGGNAAKTHFVAIPYPDMDAALKAGRVDAVMVSEPFYTLGVEAGDVPIAYPNSVYGGGTSSVYAATPSYVASHGQVIARFVRALTEASDYARAHPTQAEQVITTYTKLTLPLLKRTRIPLLDWTTTLGTATIQNDARLLVKFHFVTKPPDVAAVLP